jgi:hypothetical protein
MPRQRIASKRRNTINIPPGLLEWLNGKPMDACDDYTKCEQYLIWADYAGGLAGLIAYAQERNLMPRKIPGEVEAALRAQPKRNRD